MTYELFARYLFIAEHPFIRWTEATGRVQDEYLRKAKRVFEIAQHDYMVHGAYRQIKEKAIAELKS